MMPETYTKEQVEEAKAQARFYVINGHLIPNECGAILLSALSTAERERDALKARCAELEAIPDRLRKLDISLCPEPHGEWSLLDGEKEIAFFGDSIESVIKQAEAAIVGRKEG